jgi:hypothetical protein
MKLYKDPMATLSIAGLCLEHNELCKGSYQCLLQKEECRHEWQTIRAQNIPEGYSHAYHSLFGQMEVTKRRNACSRNAQKELLHTHALVANHFMSMEFSSLSLSNSECGPNQASNILRGRKYLRAKMYWQWTGIDNIQWCIG